MQHFFYRTLQPSLKYETCFRREKIYSDLFHFQEGLCFESSFNAVDFASKISLDHLLLGSYYKYGTYKCYRPFFRNLRV